MEEQRIGMMYVNLFRDWLGRVWDGMFPRGFRRSSALPAMVIGLVIVLPIVAWRLHRMGRFGAIKREIKGDPQNGATAGPRPGGLDPIVLTRGGTAGGTAPEFRSVTLLPGLGMDVLQITAFLPSRGEVELLAAPTVRDMADGTTPARSGANDRWGAIEAPWSGQMTGLLTPVGTSVRMNWRGKTLEAPTDVEGRPLAEGGMLGTMSADAMQALPEGRPTQAQATFKGMDFGEHWISKTDVTVSATLGERAIELAVTAKNVGDQPEPMGLGWHPRFAIPSGNRDAVEIRLPGAQQMEISDRAKGTSTGRFVEPGAAIGRFQLKPWVVGPESVDASLGHLKGAGGEGAAAEVRDPQSHFGLRVTAESAGIRELRLTSPGGSQYVGLGMQTNYDDPFGKEWNGEDAAIQTLLPGQTAEWKIRLEIFSVGSAGR